MNETHEDEFFGRMNDPKASASIKGICGDEMEFYLVIRDDRIEDIRYYTNGCGNMVRRSSGPGCSMVRSWHGELESDGIGGVTRMVSRQGHLCTG